MHKWFTRACISILFLAIAGFCWHHLYFWTTDGFSLSNIQYDIQSDPRWEVTPLTAKEKQQVDQILTQPFTYLAKGHQAYVFQSEDGKYVLKFIKFQRLRIKPWYARLPLPASLDRKRSLRADFKRNKMELLLASWATSFNAVKADTGLLAMHINPTEGRFQPVHLIDKFGLHHTVDLDHTVFALQRTVDILLTAKIKKLMDAGATDQAKQLIDNLLNLYLSEYKRGVTEADHHILRNTGVVGLIPIHLDIGQFVQDETYKDPVVYTREIAWKITELSAWLEKNYPSLDAYLRQRLKI